MKTTSTGHAITKNGVHVKLQNEIIRNTYQGMCIKHFGIYYYYTGQRLGTFIYANI